MLDQELLDILVCPENKTPVALANDDIIVKINAAIDAGTLKNRGDSIIEEKIDAGLIREDQAWLYIVRDDIPVMLIDEAIALEQIQ